MIETVADFHKLEQRLRLTGTLVTRSALRIGSGGGGELDAVDLPVLRDGDGYPFIPGGSLKGSVRSTVEALVRGAAVDRGTGLWSCDPLVEMEGPEGACGYHDTGRRASVNVTDHCAVCRLFGSRIVASHVRFTDAIVSAEGRGGGRAPVEIRDSVAIDRDLRVAHSQRKYDFEVVSPGVSFDLEVFIENPKPWLMGLLMIGFEQIADGFTALGGFTSRGLGRVDVHWSAMAQVTARDLLDGKEARSLTSSALGDEVRGWRQALATRARGDV